MGTGASSNPGKLTLNTGLAASRWKSRAHSTHSESSISSVNNLPQKDETTSQAGVDILSPGDVKVEGRQIHVKGNKKAASGGASSAQVGTKQQKAKEKSSETKPAVATSVKPAQFGNKSKSTAKKNAKTVEAKKPSTTTAALKSKGRKKAVQGSVGSDLCERVERVLQGLIEENCPVNSRTIHTEHERNALMENVYPKLREFCQKKGYEFQVVDMRWGVRDGATNTHMTTELCLREIKACQEISVGPNFVTLLSEKYGYRPLLPSIDAQEFELLLSVATDVQTRELLDKWYKKDENCFPVSYILQPVTTWIPNYFNNNNLSLKQEAQKEWQSEYNKMKAFLQQAAKEVFKDKDHDLWHKYVRSVCDVEIEYGVLQAENPKRSCVWFHRIISGLDSPEHAKNPTVLKYRDYCLDELCDRNDAHPQALLHKLKNKKMKEVMHIENIFTYDTPWTPKGINPSVGMHKNYLDQLCEDFENKLRDMITESIAEHKTAETDNFLYAEVVQHTLFCKKKIEVVYGREPTLEDIEEYVRGPSQYPLVIHGKSGCGKTAVIALAAKAISESMDKRCCVCLRFLGTTPRSSTIRRLLKSIMWQIKHVYKLTARVPRSTKGVFDQFPVFLSSATKEQPLVILLDSLDQLSPLDGARKLTWFPRQLPLHVKFIVSTLPDEEYMCFPTLKALFKDSKCFVSIPELSSTDVSIILTRWLNSEKRVLQEHQLQVLKDAFKQCPLPLFLKISYDETRLWRSYSTPSETCLETTIRKAIDKLFERVEISHGKVLVQHALGYLTAASHGLTTNELEDILSCDEALLHDVFQYWTPPIRRLPPLLWVRIRADLASYLVDRGADGAQVTYWYHRQFVQAARARYLSDSSERMRLHSAIADYFLGRNFVAENTKETTLIHGKPVRLASISGQPLILSKGRYNLRKLHELPVHLMRSERWDELKSEVLCNLHWLSTKIAARSLRSVLDNFHAAMKVVDDPDIDAVGGVLQLAQDAILSDPKQLASQFVARLYECKVQNAYHVITSSLSPVLSKLVQDSRSPPEPTLIPSRAFLTPPGGQLIETLVGHSASTVHGLAATSDGRYVVTGAEDGVVKVWDISDGSLLLTVPEAGEEIGMIMCCCDDEVIVASSKRGIVVISFETGEILHRVETKYFESYPPMTLAGNKGSKLVFLKEKSLNVMLTASGKTLHSLTSIKPVGGAGQNSLLTSWNDIVLCNSKEDENSLKVIDINNFKILHSFGVFEQTDEEEFLHLTQIVMKSENEVLVAKKMKIDLYSIDKGEFLQTYKCKIDDWIRHSSLDPNQKILVFPKRDKVAVIDLESGERKDVLQHPNYVSRTFAVGRDVILSSGGDNIVRVWDLTRQDVHRQAEKPEILVNIYSIPGDSRHLVTVSRLGIDNYCVTVWDLHTVLPLRKVTGITTSYIQIIDSRRAVVRVGEKVTIVDLQTFKVTTILKGKIPPFDFLGIDDIYVVNKRTEILTYSHDRKHLTLHDIETGDQVAILESSQPQHNLRSFIVNSQGTIAVWTDEPCSQVFVWDLVKREQRFVIAREGYERLTMSHAGLTPDGKYFVSSARKTMESDWIRHSTVWDVQNRKLAHDLRYANDTDAISLAVMDNDRVVTAHKDLNIVCWNILQGTALHILRSSHFKNLRIDVIASEGDMAVSYEEKTLILWDMKAGAQKATFTADKVTAVHLVGDGQCIALGYESVLPLVLLTLQGGDMKPYAFPTEGTTVMARTDGPIVFEGIQDSCGNEDK